jgi:hypothetical protein
MFTTIEKRKKLDSEKKYTSTDWTVCAIKQEQLEREI